MTILTEEVGGVDFDAAFDKNLVKKTARDFDRHQQNDKLR